MSKEKIILNSDFIQKDKILKKNSKCKVEIKNLHEIFKKIISSAQKPLHCV